MALNPKDAINPGQDNKKTIRLPHMLLPFDKPRLLRPPILQRNIHVIDGENLIIIPIHQEQPCARFRQRPIVQQTEFGGVLDEFLKVGAVAEFVGQAAGEVEGVFEFVDVLEPLAVEHVVAAAAECGHGEEAVGVRVGEADGVEASRAETPYDDAFAVDLRLAVGPVEESAELAVGGQGVVLCGRGVACSGDFDDDAGDAFLRPALLPHGELGTVAVEAGDDHDGWGGGFCGCRWGKAFVDVDGVAGVLRGFMRVWDLDFRDREFEHGSASVEDLLSFLPCIFLLGRSWGGEAGDAVDGAGAEEELRRLFLLTSLFCFGGTGGQFLGFGEEVASVFVPIIRFFKVGSNQLLDDGLEISDAAEHERVDTHLALRGILLVGFRGWSLFMRTGAFHFVSHKALKEAWWAAGLRMASLM